VLGGSSEGKFVGIDDVGQTILKNHAHSRDGLLDEGTLLDGLNEALLAGGNEVARDVCTDEVVAELGRRVASLLERGLDEPDDTTELARSTALLLVSVVVITMLQTKHNQTTLEPFFSLFFWVRTYH